MAKGRPAAAAGAAHEHAPAAAAETTEEHPRAAAAPKRRRGGCNRCTQVLLAAVATTIVCGSAWVAGNYWLGTNSYLTSAEIVAGGGPNALGATPPGRWEPGVGCREPAPRGAGL